MKPRKKIYNCRHVNLPDAEEAARRLRKFVERMELRKQLEESTQPPQGLNAWGS
jgi:hypothetical protein